MKWYEWKQTESFPPNGDKYVYLTYNCKQVGFYTVTSGVIRFSDNPRGRVFSGSEFEAKMEIVYKWMEKIKEEKEAAVSAMSNLKVKSK